MVNILLTNKCVRQCPYCFAGREMARSAATEFLSLENVVYLADFLRRSGQRRVSLIGGEPTLHPEFVDIVLYFLARHFEVTVFTSGLLSDARLFEVETYLAKASPNRLTFVCNVNDPALTPATDDAGERLARFLEIAGRWSMLGFNIYRDDFSLDFAFDLFRRYDLKRTLRLGLAHPTASAENAFLSVERIGPAIARLQGFKAEFQRLGIAPSLDCGFPLCQFSDADLGWLVRLGGRANFTCRPAIDITPDMEVYACFPLATRERASLFTFDTLEAMMAHFAGQHARLRADRPGIYDACGTCDDRARGTCAGGASCQIALEHRTEKWGRFSEKSDA